MSRIDLIKLLRTGLRKNPAALAPTLLTLPASDLEEFLPVYLRGLRRQLRQNFNLPGLMAYARASWRMRYKNLGLTPNAVIQFWSGCQSLEDYIPELALLTVALSFELENGTPPRELPLSCLSARDWLYWELGCPVILPANVWLKLALGQKAPDPGALQQLAYRSQDKDFLTMVRNLPFVSPWSVNPAKEQIAGSLISPGPDYLAGRISHVTFLQAAGEDYTHLEDAGVLRSFPAIRVGGMDLEVLLCANPVTLANELIVTGLTVLPGFDSACVRLADQSLLHIQPGRSTPFLEQSEYLILQIMAGGMDYEFVLVP